MECAVVRDKALWRRLLAWGPLVTLSLIGGIFAMTMLTCFTGRGLLRPHSSFEAALYITEVCLLMWSYLTAAYVGPGKVPLNWSPDDDALKDETARLPKPIDVPLRANDVLQHCGQCDGFKPPRAHHCSSCGQCVMKMDHHCPWINNCIGHCNQRFFLQFTFYVPLACTHTAVLLFEVLHVIFFRILRQDWSRPEARVPITNLRAIMAAWCWFVAVGLVVIVGGLGYQQVKAIHRNMTQVERYIMAKARSRLKDHPSSKLLPYPYDVGTRRNWAAVMTSNPVYWFLPIAVPTGGVWWPLIPGVSQFDFSMEQLAQKADKKQRSKLVICKKPYDGRFRSWCMCWCLQLFRIGCRTSCSCPSLDEPRLTLSKGDYVWCTRYEKHWMFGKKEVVSPAGEARPDKGWFPRGCVFKAPVAKQREKLVPEQRKLQGKWDTGSGQVEVVETVVLIPGTQYQYVLHGEFVTSLIGVKLIRAEEDLLEWDGGVVWRRPADDKPADPTPLPENVRRRAQRNVPSDGS